LFHSYSQESDLRVEFPDAFLYSVMRVLLSSIWSAPRIQSPVF